MNYITLWQKKNPPLKYYKILLTLKLNNMLRWSFLFLIIAIIAAILGFTGIAAGAASIAKILFFIFLAVWVVMLVLGVTIFKKS